MSTYAAVIQTTKQNLKAMREANSKQQPSDKFISTVKQVLVDDTLEDVEQMIVIYELHKEFVL